MLLIPEEWKRLHREWRRGVIKGIKSNLFKINSSDWYPCILILPTIEALYLKLSNIVLQEKRNPLYDVIDLLNYLN